MASTIDPSIIAIFLGIIVVTVTIIIIATTRKPQLKTQYQSTGHSNYVSGQFSRQMELDMRLPYRRFKQLYPYSPWTYEEYKKMQRQTAFRRSTSSTDNKRMVR